MTATPSTTPTPLPTQGNEEDPNLMTAYTLWAVFRRPRGEGRRSGIAAVDELDEAVSGAHSSVTFRGFYDVSGFRADADVMVWLHGDDAQQLQAALRLIRRTVLFDHAEPAWNAMGMHREAEFKKRHTPAFLRGKDPEAWITVYPFVRSYEWYLLPEDERAQMLRDHGVTGGKYRRILTNTVASFALGDYEWILPLESPDLVDLVDMMRDLRSTEARRHVREEVPFFTGRRISTAELPEVLSQLERTLPPRRPGRPPFPAAIASDSNLQIDCKCRSANERSPVTQVLLVIHLVAGILFVGPSAVATSLFPGYVPVREGESVSSRHPRSLAVAQILHRICRVYGLLALIVPAAGIALAIIGNRFTEIWLISAMVLTAIAGVILAVRIVPMQAGTLAAPASRKQISALGGFVGIFNLLWVVVVILMVTQPGAGR